jgi:hypothetical protein
MSTLEQCIRDGEAMGLRLRGFYVAPDVSYAKPASSADGADIIRGHGARFRTQHHNASRHVRSESRPGHAGASR